MKKIALLTLLTVLTFGLAGTASAYEGGTKMVATMTHPEKGAPEWGPLIVIPHDGLTPGKAFQNLLRRVPTPTLSIERIREEKPGRSLGTKPVTRFWKEGRL